MDLSLDFFSVVEILEEFDGVKVISQNSNINARGIIEESVTISAPEDCKNDLPPSLMKVATNLSYIASTSPIEVLGKFSVTGLVDVNTRMEITFNIDRRFVFLLHKARENYIYKKFNREVDHHIDKWLSEGNDGHQ